jgi:hypothetical protein
VAGRDALPRVRRCTSGNRGRPFILNSRLRVRFGLYIHGLWTHDDGRAGAHPYHATTDARERNPYHATPDARERNPYHATPDARERNPYHATPDARERIPTTRRRMRGSASLPRAPVSITVYTYELSSPPPLSSPPKSLSSEARSSLAFESESR